MTNEELIQAFPECEKIKRDDMRQCIIEAMEKEQFYSTARSKVNKKAHALWPHKREWRDLNPEFEAYKQYFWSDWPRKAPFDEWLMKLEDEFIERHGQAHTFDEACQLAADEWVRMIFGHHMQDNGDKSDAGGMGMLLATLVKDRLRRNIKAGVPRESIGDICPWKTEIIINERDNAVCIRGYQTQRFI